jgi:hypothetical protein
MATGNSGWRRRFPFMRQMRTSFLAAALVLGALPAHAFAKPDFNAPSPIPHVREAGMAQSQPRVMNYTDQMAHSLGVRDGGWEAFKSTDPMMPSLKGGIDSGAPMLKLQWRP